MPDRSRLKRDVPTSPRSLRSLLPSRRTNPKGATTRAVPQWTRLFASWTPVTRQVLADQPMASRVAEWAAEDVDGYLADAGAVAVSPMTFALSGEPAITSIDGVPLGNHLILLAEVEGLVLRHPNPMPYFDLFRSKR